MIEDFVSDVLGAYEPIYDASGVACTNYGYILGGVIMIICLWFVFGLIKTIFKAFLN